MRYELIETHPEYSVAKWVKHLNVSSSGYHSWKRNKPEREARKELLKRKIKEIFEESRQTYGAEKIAGIIIANGGKANRPVVQRHMNEMGLTSVHRKVRSKSLTDSRKNDEGISHVSFFECRSKAIQE